MLDEQRETQRHKLAQSKFLQEIIRPFENPQSNIQPNLVTKDGELTKELERLKVLVARMGEKIKEAPGNHTLEPSEQMETQDVVQKLALMMNDKHPTPSPAQ